MGDRSLAFTPLLLNSFRMGAQRYKFMDLRAYFEQIHGHGVLATADASGKVNAAIYARPHFAGPDSLAFIMADRLTHANLQSNPHAVYLFIESGAGYAGKRLYLTKTREEQNDALVQEICRRCDYSLHKGHLTRYVVFFRIEKVLPLIGSQGS